MMMRVLFGRDCRTFLMWTARSWRLSIAGTHHSHDTKEITRTIKHMNTHWHKNTPKDERLTDTGYEVMEDFLREEGLVQSSKVQLQDASNGVHVMVILVPCQRVLTYIQTRRRRGEGGGQDRKDYKALEKTKWSCFLLDDSFTSLKGILDVVDFHLRAWHSEDALMLQTYTDIKTHTTYTKYCKTPVCSLVFKRGQEVLLKFLV